MAPIAKLLAPSLPEEASVTIPNGAAGSVVPGVADQSWRHWSTRACMLQEYPALAAEFPMTEWQLFSPWSATNAKATVACSCAQNP